MNKKLWIPNEFGQTFGCVCIYIPNVGLELELLTVLVILFMFLSFLSLIQQFLKFLCFHRINNSVGEELICMSVSFEWVQDSSRSCPSI